MIIKKFSINYIRSTRFKNEVNPLLAWANWGNFEKKMHKKFGG